MHDFVTLLGYFLSQFGVIMLNETWYSDDEKMYILQGNNPFYLNRHGKRGVGVSIYVRQNMKCELMAIYTEMRYDFQALTVKSNYLIFLVLRPPSASFDKFCYF